MVVTRVSRGDGVSLAKEVVMQLGQLKKVRVIIGCIAVLLALVPGMPWIPFSTLGIVMIISTAHDLSQSRKGESFNAPRYDPKLPALLEVRAKKETLISITSQPNFIPTLEDFRKSIFTEQGLFLNYPEITPDESIEGSFQILLRGIPIKCAVNSSDDVLSDLIHQLHTTVHARTIEFIDDTLTRGMLDHFSTVVPELTASVVPGIIPLTKLTEILRKLAEEKISIRNFDVILQAISEKAGKCAEDDLLLAEVRVALARIISSKYSDTNGAISGYTIEPTLNLALTGEGNEASTEYDEYTLLNHIVEFLKEHETEHQVLLCSKSSRRFLFECFQARDSNIPILAFEEIDRDFEFNVVGNIEWPSKVNEEESLAA